MIDYQPHSNTELLHHNQASFDELQKVLRREAGEFSLTLAACNYNRLRHLVVDQFVQTGQAMELRLLPDVISLVDAIHQSIGDTSPAALMVTGLELLQKPELIAILKGANLSRDEFRKHFSFPVVLWVTERVRQKFTRYAPDLRSYSPPAIAFTLPRGELLYYLKVTTNQLFFNILERGGDRDLATLTLQLRGYDTLRNELEFAIQDLTTNGLTPDPDLQASLDFLRGRDAHSRMDMAAAQEHYQRSLAYWEAKTVAGFDAGDVADIITPADKQAVLWLHLGLWWRNYAERQRGQAAEALRAARRYFELLLRYFRDEDAVTRTACFIHFLAEVLQKQRDWETLEYLAVEGLSLHQQTQDAIRMARNRGFLAEVALIREDWLTAQSEATHALTLLETAQKKLKTTPEDIDLHNALKRAQRFQRGWYRFLLGEALIRLSEIEQALQYLDAARWETDPAIDLTLYLQILQGLIRHYFDLGYYWDAFDVKQELRQVEYGYNRRAFVGAGTVKPHQRTTVAQTVDDPTNSAVAAEIQASGRLQDVKALTTRLADKTKRLVVIHGPSGVGKSSILNAGLLPALRTLYPSGRTTLPILVQTYSNWQQGIAAELDTVLAPWQDKEQMLDDTPEEALVRFLVGTAPAPIEPPTPDALVDQLKIGVQKNRFFVLVFDQFEEFFFEKPKLIDRRPFYEFFQKCLDQPWVKVVLSLREDYLHHLLEMERIVNQVSPMAGAEALDMLSLEVRYALANFSPIAAEAVIRQLTEAAQYPLEDGLIHRLVADLAAETEDIRPIELQVVGAQLQRQEIHTLAQYEGLGDSPKETLVQQFLAYVVHDCGPPNQTLAWGVLFLLTDEDRDQRLYRPLKTREELEAELTLRSMPFGHDQLSMVLSILVGSGLVFQIPEEPEDRYQLVHDYLVPYVRNEQTPTVPAELAIAEPPPTSVSG